MTCRHLLKDRCGCPKDPPATSLGPLELPADLVATRVAQLAVPPPEPKPEEVLFAFAEPPKKHHAGPGQPRSPWRKRKEEEAAYAAEIERRVLSAVQAGDANDVIQALDLALAKIHFSTFCRLAWHVIEPSTHLEWGRHHELICTVLQALFEDWWIAKQDRNYLPLVRNTVINVCPGSLKSRIVNVLFPAWCWLRAPGMKFICVSVNDAAAQRDARDNRTLIVSDWYQTSFHPDWSIREENDAIKDFGNTAGGGRLSRASGSVIVGLRGDCVAGETLVATEDGDIEIRRLHEDFAAGNPVPRVWTQNHETGELELKTIQMTRCIPEREAVDIRTESNQTLRCTDDHRIFSEEEQTYLPARDITGRRVSILQGSDSTISTTETVSLSKLPVGEIDLCRVQSEFRTFWSGVRQASETRANRGTILQQELQDEALQSSSDLEGLFTVPKTLSTEIEEDHASVLFQEVLSVARNRPAAPSSFRSSVPAMLDHVPTDFIEEHLLLEALCQSSTFSEDERYGKLELLRSKRETVCRDVVAASGTTDSSERRMALHDVWAERDASGLDDSSYRRKSGKQPPDKPDHTLRSVPYDAPQVTSGTVLSVDPAFESGRRAKVDVYDLQIEGNHNFFAGGILVHNCLLGDDLSDPEKSSEEAERTKVKQVWDNNQYNRVNDPLRSLRICIQQRVHVEDHTGHVLKKQGLWSKKNPNGWLHVVLPAEFEVKRGPFQLPVGLRKYVRNLPGAVLKDWRTQEGEILHPARMTPQFLADEKKRWAGTSNYAGQMQQRPADIGGGKVKKHWFGWFRLASGVRDDIDEHDTGRPRPDGCEKNETIIIPQAHYRPGYWDFDLVAITVDPAMKRTEKGSLWGMIAWGVKGGRRFALDDRSQRGESDEALQIIKDMVTTWKPDKLMIEAKAGGDGLRRSLEIEMANGDMPMVELVMTQPGTQDKEARLNAALPTLANGMVFLREGAAWVYEYVEELTSFPNYSTNDRVDATSMIVNDLDTDDVAFPSASAWESASMMTL